MTKRSNNEGTLYRMSNGRWRAQLSITGKRVSHTSVTKRECQEWLDMHKQLEKDSPKTEGAFQTLEQYLQFWLVQIEMVIRPTTLYQYRLYCTKHIYPHLGSIRLCDLRLNVIQDLYNSLNKAGYGTRTIKIVHNVIHHAMEDAMSAGHVNRNPATGAKLPKSEQKEMKFLSEDQVSQLLLAAQGDRYEALYHLAIATGLRQSEILGLQWSDLDLNRGILKVERQLNRSFKENDYFAQTKTKNGRRVLKLGAATIEKLQENRVTQNLDKAIAGARWKENNLVFPSSIGTPLNQRNLFNRFLALLDKAGLPRIRFHDLRHTSASLLLNHNIPMIVVSRRLGHYKVSFTMDTYGHTVPEMQEEAANLIDDLITPVRIQLHTVAHGTELQPINTVNTPHI